MISSNVRFLVSEAKNNENICMLNQEDFVSMVCDVKECKEGENKKDKSEVIQTNNNEHILFCE
jgi:hypothetical protein